MNDQPKSHSWWQTFPGILTALAGVLTALGGLLLTLQKVGCLSQSGPPAAPATTISHGSESSTTPSPWILSPSVTTSVLRTSTPTPVGIVEDEEEFARFIRGTWKDEIKDSLVYTATVKGSVVTIQELSGGHAMGRYEGTLSDRTLDLVYITKAGVAVPGRFSLTLSVDATRLDGDYIGKNGTSYPLAWIRGR